jgi:cytochrome P450
MTTTFEINLVDPDVYERAGPPHAHFAWLREHAPVFWHADGGGPGWPGFWAVTRHADVVHVSRHPEIFSAAPSGFASGRTQRSRGFGWCWPAWTRRSTPASAGW